MSPFLVLPGEQMGDHANHEGGGHLKWLSSLEAETCNILPQ